jgi:hypothetical protein
MEEFKSEFTQKNVDAAFDSVNLINALNEKESLTEEETSRREANVEHLRIMMTKPEFVVLLTKAQKTEINNLIK